MSAKRMFNLSVVNSDNFLLDLELSSQALYFHLAMRADDDGFVENPRTIRRMTGASESDYRALIDRGYLIAFESGPAVVTHWFLHNTIKQDRYKQTIFQDELRTLKIIDGVYKPRDPEELQEQPEPEDKGGNQEKPEALEHPEGKQKAADPEGKQAGMKDQAAEGKADPEGGKSAFFEGGTVWKQSGTGTEPERKQGGTGSEPQVSIDKSSIDKSSIEREEGEISKGFSKVEGKDKTRAHAREIVDNSGIVDNSRKGTARKRLEDLPPEVREKVLSFNRRMEDMKRGVG